MSSSGGPEPLDITVVLVRPKFQGNVGAVARACENFGVNSLVLVDPPSLEDEAHQRALHAAELMDNAPVFASLDEAMTNVGSDIWVAASAKMNTNAKCHRRNPETPAMFFGELNREFHSISLVFGREDTGLLNPEVEACDRIVTIPTYDLYPVMNLSHAVAIVLYEASRDRKLLFSRPLATTPSHRESFVRMFDEMVGELQLPEVRARNASLLFRRMMARSQPTQWEFFTLMGVFNRATRLLRGWEPGSEEAGDVRVELFEKETPPG